MARAAQPQFLSLPPSPPPPPPPRFRRKIQSSIAFPPKPTRKSNRKNYLRTKLPIPPSKISPQTPLQEIPNTKHFFQRVEDDFQEEGNDGAPDDGKREFDLQTTAISTLPAVESGNSVARIAFYWLGSIVVQTLITVWFLSSRDVHNDNAGSGNSAVGVSVPEAVDGTGGKEIGDAVGSLNGPEFEKKVLEIRAMAKEARALEKKSGNVGAGSSSVVGADGDDDDEIVAEDAVSSVKTDVRKEVDQRLMSLQRNLRSRREVSPRSSHSNARRGKWAFGRKSETRNAPKGFDVSKYVQSGSINGGVTSNQEEMYAADGNLGAIGVAGEEEEESHWLRDEVMERIVLKLHENALAGRDPLEGFGSKEELNFFLALERKFQREGERAKQWMENKLDVIDIENGHTQEAGEESPLEGLVEPYEKIQSSALGKISVMTTKSNATSAGSSLDIQKNRFSGDTSSQNGNHEIYTAARNQIPPTSNGGSKKGQQSKGVGDKSELQKAKNGQLNIKKNSWWLKLPYVFAILLQRGDDDKKSPSGLYSLKMNSASDDGSPGTCTITFEHGSDANNFCHVLESFFEDLGDFSAEAVPLSMKEIKEKLESSSLKLIVVRKGQLQLYAGQPLEDVERALHAIDE